MEINTSRALSRWSCLSLFLFLYLSIYLSIYLCLPIYTYDIHMIIHSTSSHVHNIIYINKVTYWQIYIHNYACIQTNIL